MRKHLHILVYCVWALCQSADGVRAQDKPALSTPAVEITNGPVKAVIQLPDAEHGSYRGTRFDWSGVVSSLQYAGHEYVGQWHDIHDPKINDAVTGPAEEFLTNGSSLGYAEAKPGEIFPRIGVGTIRKPADEKSFRRFVTYDIVDPGKWSIRKKKDRVEFTHQLTSGTGYSYVYKKTVRLVKGKPELEIEHSLKNTGQKAIETSQYSHNFFAMDQQVVGPDVSVQFAFPPSAAQELKFGAHIQDRQILYTQELEAKQSAASDLSGFSQDVKDYDIRVENRRTGTGVHIVGDQPLQRLYFWSIRTVACPEPYVHFNIEPGSEAHWTIRYEFYTLPLTK